MLSPRSGDRWYVDETYVKVNGIWRYVYRAVDQYGQAIDVLVSDRRDADAAQPHRGYDVPGHRRPAHAGHTILTLIQDRLPACG